MLFQFTVNLTDQDYLDYNIFHMLKSPYGKKIVTRMRLYVALLVGAAVFFMLLREGYLASAVYGVAVYIVIFVLLQLFLPKSYVWVLKSQMKDLKKKGKMGYSPVADMAFLDESFVETTPDNRTEQKYSSVERVSVVTGKCVYLHTNSVAAYILPQACFDSGEQYEKFLAFIRTKCPNVDVY